MFVRKSLVGSLMLTFHDLLTYSPHLVFLVLPVKAWSLMKFNGFNLYIASLCLVSMRQVAYELDLRGHCQIFVQCLELGRPIVVMLVSVHG